jgi:IS605 OrfB family transposase
MPKANTTTRAYTLKLRGNDGKTNHEWKDALWTTHIFVNDGAAIWGDFLLSARAGIQAIEADKEPDERERAWKRRICSLSWLTVEFQPQERLGLTLPAVENPELALCEILNDQGLSAGEVDSWLRDCLPSLQTEIRRGARRINRYNAFKTLDSEIPGGLSQEDREDFVGRFIKAPDFFLLADPNESRSADLAQSAGNWLSNRFGTGEGSDYGALALTYRNLAAFSRTCRRQNVTDSRTAIELLKTDQYLSRVITIEEDSLKVAGVKGRPSATCLKLRKLTEKTALDDSFWSDLEAKATADADKAGTKTGQKGPRPYAAYFMNYFERQTGVAYQFGGRNLTWEFAVILDHAARKVVALHSWVKRQEAERRNAQEELAAASVGDVAEQLLEEFTQTRQFIIAPTEKYRIRKRAITGWRDIVTAWSARRATDVDERISIARELQEEVDKFGDIQLFEALARDEYRPVWQDGPESLEQFVSRQALEALIERRKVPAYRAPDPCFHPIYCDYGNSRWSVEYTAQKEQSASRAISLSVFDGKAIRDYELFWSSKRIARDLLSSLDGAPGIRSDRLGAAVAGGGPVRPLGLFDEGEWNARLQADRDALEQLAKQFGVVDPREWPVTATRQLQWRITFSAKLTPLPTTVTLTNEDREGFPLMKRLFSGKPAGLRVLSVDLGLRAGASCAVWETVEDAVLRQHLGPAQLSPHELHLTAGPGGRFYRRVSQNMWARLDRQFVIQLNGEKDEARRLTPDERARIGAALPGASEESLAKPFPEAVADIIVAARRELDLLGTWAKLAYALRNPEPDARSILSALARWRSRTVRLGPDSAPAALWRHCFPLHPDLLDAAAGNSARAEERLELMAAALARAPFQATSLAATLESHWARSDARWPALIKSLRQLVAPRKSELADPRLARCAGGLSIDRIANVNAVRKLMRAYQYRPVPSDPRKNIPDDVDERPFAARLQGIHSRLREQRVKQLASRILEAALGLGREPARGAKRDRRLPDDDRFARCPVVVIENLTGYGTDQVQTRRENRQLAQWSKAQIDKHLRDGCQLHGIYVWSVTPSYTSQYDFRTGSAGIRCRRVTAKYWLRPYWAKELARARNENSPYAEYLRALDRTFLSGSHNPKQAYLVPARGGNVFVQAAQPALPKVSSLDADLNAAANIGLWALLDPSWSPRWHRIRVAPETHLPHPSCPAPGLDPARPVGSTGTKPAGRTAKNAPYQNLFLAAPAADLASADWMTYGQLAAHVRDTVCRHLRWALEYDPDSPF